VQGSGSQSLFFEVDTPNGTRIVSGGPEAAVMKCARDRVRVLAVEKPGVEFLVQQEQPGGAEEGSAMFCREHTLPRWVEALHAAVEAAADLPGVDARAVLALGHSEGAMVVCHLPARNARVTHVASFAGGGPTQLYDLLHLAREGKLGPPDGDAASRVAWLTAEWKKVLAAPDADDQFFLGHPHRRWTTFATAATIPTLLASKAAVFLAQGTSDTAVAVSAVDVLHAELLARGREVVYERIDGADHGLCVADDRERKGWIDVHRKAVDWFLRGR
jgi:dienelactone hydrolase